MRKKIEIKKIDTLGWKAFELDLYGYTHIEIKDKLAKEFDFEELTVANVRTLIAAEDIMYALASTRRGE